MKLTRTSCWVTALYVMLAPITSTSAIASVDYGNWKIIIELVDQLWDAGKGLGDALDGIGLEYGVPDKYFELRDVAGKLRQQNVDDETPRLRHSLNDVLSDDIAVVKATLRDVEKWIVDADQSLAEMRERQKTCQQMYELYRDYNARLSSTMKSLDVLINDPAVKPVMAEALLSQIVRIHYLIPEAADIEGEARRLSRGYAELITRRAMELENTRNNVDVLIRPYVQTREDIEKLLKESSSMINDSVNRIGDAARLEDSARQAGSVGLEAARSTASRAAGTSALIEDSAEKAEVTVQRVEEIQRKERMRQEQERRIRESSSSNSSGGNNGADDSSRAGRDSSGQPNQLWTEMPKSNK